MSELSHWGIKGMRWGVRRYQNEDGTLTEAGKARRAKQIDKEARKDARKYVNAKQYYGKGAGNRRKLLKGELSEKMKDPDYKKAFDEYVKNEDYVKATTRAKAERNTRDTIEKAKRITKKVLPIVGPIAISVLAAYKFNKDAKNSANWSSNRAKEILDKFNLNISDLTNH